MTEELPRFVYLRATCCKAWLATVRCNTTAKRSSSRPATSSHLRCTSSPCRGRDTPHADTVNGAQNGHKGANATAPPVRNKRGRWGARDRCPRRATGRARGARSGPRVLPGARSGLGPRCGRRVDHVVGSSRGAGTAHPRHCRVGQQKRPDRPGRGAFMCSLGGAGPVRRPDLDEPAVRLPHPLHAGRERVDYRLQPVGVETVDEVVVHELDHRER